ncbi:MAG: phosphoribosylanthranilate isomerase, partial [Candidatus Poribacteria bacterium]
MKKYKVKLCGTTSIESAKMAIDARADYIGVLVNVGISERSLNVEQAKAIVNFSKIPVMTLLYNMSVDEICHIYNEIKPYGVHLLGNTPVENVSELRKKLDCHIWLTVYLPAKDQGEVDVGHIKELMKNYKLAGADKIVIDTISKGRYGGTGKTADWDIAKDLVKSV